MSATSGIPAGNLPVNRFDADEKAVLILLLEDRYTDRIDAVDAVASLAGDGLVHRFGDFVFPTRAARRSDELYEGAL